MAHATASSSNSIVAYRDSASDKNLDPAWTKDQLSPCCCWRMYPSPCRLASVLRRVGLVMSKKDKTGCMVRDSLAVWKAVSWLGDHTNSFLVLNKGRSGANSVATALVLEDN